MEVTAEINGAGGALLNPGETGGTRTKGIGGMFKQDDGIWGRLK